jgi:murein DD-endopeptidase MepM/ murein hydrolase activator NlpD
MILCPLENTGKLIFGKYWLQERPYITQLFGERPDVYKQFGLNGHNGIDFRCAVGTLVYAPMEGKVQVTNEGKSGYGLHIKIRGGDREIVLGHLSEVFIKDGETVRLGQKIALSGNTGFSTGPHLHFGLRSIIKGEGDIFKWTVARYDNGFKGYWDQKPFVVTYKGTLSTKSIS